ncbi:XkdF-like putative serine protease domain-containing protein [Haloarchaeobius sp. HRN-SO-5]|uniref:XkdF-like putative serine protease domain-containing protein n=1 Tax=Haloarchaeobius sp. HRN-SO-5 TaxID=3446118 RepID=UPI003EB94385
MPPVTKAGGEQFRKDVSFVTKEDDAEQVAAGIVMVPDKADLQNDFAREETIRGFASQFEAFVEAGEAGGGIMHAVFPDDWMTLERNEVLTESEEIGGNTVDAGAWVQEWRITNADLWSLIDDEILAGYSIGAIQVDWNGPFEQDEVDNVAIPDALGEDELVWELTDGIIREVSAVDIPAVPDAQILDTKADAEKRLSDYLGDQDGFIEEALQRGHSEAEAERLWDVLNEAVAVDGAGEPGKQSMFARAGKAFLSALSGSDDTTASDEDQDAATVKEGRTLSTANRDSLFATIDASLDILQNAGVDHGMTRFTDRGSVDFDLTEHQARTWSNDDNDDGDGEDDEEEDDEEEAGGKDASGGDNPDNDTTDMTDDNPDDPEGDDKSLAEQNAEQISELTQAVESLTETIAGPQPKTAEFEIDGETYEIPESSAKAALGVGKDADHEDIAAAIASLKQDAERVDELEDRLDTITRQSGVGSQQLDAAAEGGEEGDETGLDSLGKALS